jgi:hypothetical protein
VFCFVSRRINKTQGGMCYVSKMAAGPQVQVFKARMLKQAGVLRNVEAMVIDVNGSVSLGEQGSGACQEARGRTKCKQHRQRYWASTYHMGHECGHA